VLAGYSPVDDLIPGPSGIGSDADALVAARLAAGDHRALTEVVDRLGPAVYGVALRVLGYHAGAQDVVQDVFVELWSHPDRYDPSAGSLRGYLTMQARHRAVDLVRSEVRRVALSKLQTVLAPQLLESS
jgi:RNA polymerase sigma-70 factor, ECF subfamily